MFTCGKLRVQNILENALEKLSEGLKLQNFPGGACPQTPLAFVHYARVKRVFTCLLSAPLLKNIFLRHCYIQILFLYDLRSLLLITTCLEVCIINQELQLTYSEYSRVNHSYIEPTQPAHQLQATTLSQL